MNFFKNWRVDRFIRLFLGFVFIIASFFLNSNYFVAMIIAGSALLFSAVNGRCPFNACEVKAPVKFRDNKDFPRQDS